MKREDTPRIAYDQGRAWFPIMDLSGTLRSPRGGLRSGVSRWMRDNLPSEAVSLKKFDKTDRRRAGNLLCVDAERAILVGMYASHIGSGRDFRARWSELPDYPSFDPRMREEVYWRNIWRLSRRELQARGGINQTLATEMRLIWLAYGRRFGREPSGSWEETRRGYLEYSTNPVQVPSGYTSEENPP